MSEVKVYNPISSSVSSARLATSGRIKKFPGEVEMHESIFQTVRENTQALKASQSSLRAKISETRDSNGNSISISQKLADADYSFSEIDVAISALTSFVEEVKPDEQGAIIPRSLIEALASKLLELKNQIDALSTVFDTVSQQGGVKSIDSASFVVVAQENDAQHSLVKPIRRIFGQLDAALIAWFQLRSILKNPKFGDFGRILNGITRQQSDLGKLIEDNAKLGKSLRDEQGKIAEVLSQATNERNEVGRLLQEAQNDRKTLSEYSAEGAEKISSVRTTHQEATSLHSGVTEYQSNFSRFDGQLKAREEKFQKENEDLAAIHARIGENETEINRLLKESEGMLRGATNVGLAASFSSLQSKINSELRWARYSFYFSILMLVALSIPIALYVFPGLHALFGALTGIDPTILVPKNAANHTTSDVIAQVAARALLLIPGIWLVRFTSARHERLFRLREHYAYKYSVASSVEGFKKQAPDLEQGIAAATFYELTFNPATRMDANSSETRHPNPVMEYVMKKLGGDGQK